MYDGMCGRWIAMSSFADLNDGFEYYRNFDFICCDVKNGVGCYVVSIYGYAW